MKVFLGGTCAESKWREKLIPLLKCDYFNPVVDDWTPECQKIEEDEKKICDYHLYVITPKMQGVYSIAEAVNDAHLPKARTTCIFCVTREDDDREWTKGEKKSLDATSELIAKHGGLVFYSLEDIANYLNKTYEEQIKINQEKDEKQKYTYFEKRTYHLLNLYNQLVGTILPEGWYSSSSDTWEVEKDELEECIRRLNRPFVQRIIKRN